MCTKQACLHGWSIVSLCAPDSSFSPLRISYRSLIVWLYADPDVLNTRLDQRVDEMIAAGLLDEIRTLRDSVLNSAQNELCPNIKSGSESGTDDWISSSGRVDITDYTLGVFQSIGFKEFNAYIANGNVCPTLYATAIAEMKTNTRRYAQRQIKWIRNKLLPAVRASNETAEKHNAPRPTYIYLLDTADLQSWNDDVLCKAKTLLHAFLRQVDLPDASSLSSIAQNMLAVPNKPTDPTGILVARRKIICSSCTTNTQQPVMIEDGREWESHCRTRAHKRMFARRTGDACPSESTETIIK